MKKLIFLVIIALLSVSVSFYSCKDDDPDPPVIQDDNDDDDGDPIHEITTEVFKTTSEAEAFVNGAYGPLQTLSSSFSFLLESHTESTISFEGAETAGGPEASRLETTPANSYANKLFNAFYNSIGITNGTIEKLDSSKVTAKLTQESKDLLRGRALFIRGLSYLYLVQLYGEVPLRVSTVKPLPTSRESIDKIYEQIVADLTEAETLLPEYDVIRSNPSKGAANGLLARAYLTWGHKPLSQSEVEAIKNATTDPAHSVDNAKLEKAVEYADKVIGSDQYQLETDFNQNFGVARENRSVEHIYTIHHDGDNNGDAQGNHQTHCPFTERFDLWTDNHIGPADVTLVDRFEAGDSRKLFSILTELYNGDEIISLNPTVYQLYHFEFPVTSPRYGKFIHRAGYTAATRERAPGSSAGQPNNINRIELRYAEVLLYKAEALFYLGRVDEALPLINQLRQRAFGDATHNLNASTLTEAALHREWDLELTFEQKHWQNLVRWKKLISTIKTVDQFEYYKEDYKDNASVIAKAKSIDGTLQDQDINAAFFAKIYKHLHAKYNNAKGKLYRFPIPTTSGINQGVSPQNPGY
jgi:tetratricopeptide (TPR) repeat protein